MCQTTRTSLLVGLHGLSSRSKSAPALFATNCTGPTRRSTTKKCCHDKSSTNSSEHGKIHSQWLISCKTLDDGDCAFSDDFGTLIEDEMIWELDSDPSRVNPDPRNQCSTALVTKSQENTSCTKEVHMLAGWKHLLTSNNFC